MQRGVGKGDASHKSGLWPRGGRLHLKKQPAVKGGTSLLCPEKWQLPSSSLVLPGGSILQLFFKP